MLDNKNYLVLGDLVTNNDKQFYFLIYYIKHIHIVQKRTMNIITLTASKIEKVLSQKYFLRVKNMMFEVFEIGGKILR